MHYDILNQRYYNRINTKKELTKHLLQYSQKYVLTILILV